jgi:hypothetical protein
LPLVATPNWCGENCVAKASWNWKHKVRLMGWYNVSPMTMRQIPLEGLVMTKKWTAPRICAIRHGMWPCMIWEQSWNNCGNPFTESSRWNNLKGVQKPPGKKVTCRNATCVGMPTWKSQIKVQGLGLIHSFLKKMGGNNLIKDVKQRMSRWCHGSGCRR